MGCETTKQAVERIGKMKFEDITNKVELEVYKELYPQYKTKMDLINENLVFWLVTVPLLILTSPVHLCLFAYGVIKKQTKEDK